MQGLGGGETGRGSLDGSGGLYPSEEPALAAPCVSSLALKHSSKQPTIAIGGSGLNPRVTPTQSAFTVMDVTSGAVLPVIGVAVTASSIVLGLSGSVQPSDTFTCSYLLPPPEANGLSFRAAMDTNDNALASLASASVTVT